MRLTKRISSLILTVLMLVTVTVSAVTTAGAIAGGGIVESANVAHGVDLSYWNVATSSGIDYSCVDFEAMLADGCDFAILRIGYGQEGSYELDEPFVQLYNNAREAGMPLGVYFYSYATTYAGAKADAEWVIGIIEQYDMYFEYPIYYDVEEDDQEALDSTGTTNLCLGWCETLEEAGYYPGVYSTYYYIEDLSDSFRDSYDVWLAQVLSASSTGSTSGQYNTTDYNESDYCGMWQYSWYDYLYDGYDPPTGMENALDVNVAYKDYPSIMEQHGFNNMGSGDLASAIAKAKKTVYSDYSEEALNTLHEVYLEAVALDADVNATDAEKDMMAAKLTAAINNTASKETVLSKGKNYETTAPNRTGDASDVDWSDDGDKLTDGVKGKADVINNSFAAWSEGVTVDIIVDLGSDIASNVYRFYAVSGDWEVYAPSKFSVSVSTNGTDFTKIATSSERTQVTTYDVWTSYCYSVITDETHTARYIKFTVTPDGNHTWMDEVEVAYNSDPPYTGGVYVDGFNSYILSGETYIFTPDFGTITTTTANHTYTQNVIAKWDSAANAYVVTDTFHGGGLDNTPDVTLASDEIMIAAHNWETGITDGTAVEGSAQNANNLASFEIGDILTLNGIDIENKELNVAPYIGTAAPSPIVSIGASANAALGGVRFGAQYTKNIANGEVKTLGFLLISKYRLGSETLDLDYASNSSIAKYVVDVVACGIIEYDPNKKFEDYNQFTYYATVIGLGAHADQDIVAVPYIIYSDGTSYVGATITNSLNGVLAGESSFK